ncbi:MAG: archaeosortase/exosortase family protein, partial [Kiritimatiellaeota bacterium]|nr:archaeosortase/exosortase family protein [Kiritimatiellota bacterium]
MENLKGKFPDLGKDGRVHFHGWDRYGGACAGWDFDLECAVMNGATDNDSSGRSSSAILSERWRLAVLSREQLIQIGFMSAIIGLIYVLFHLLGNTVENVSSKSAFMWMIARWNDSISYGGADYSHGWLIPPVSLGVLWFKRRELIAAPKAVCQWGLAVIVLALMVHWLGAKISQTRLSLIALIMLLWGMPLYFF